MKNPFFLNEGPFKFSEILSLLDVKKKIVNDFDILNVGDLSSNENKNITFFHSIKYKEIASKTKAICCITTKDLEKYIPEKCNSIIVDNVLIAISIITKKFYPSSVSDFYDNNVDNIENIKLDDSISFGKNVLVGKNVKIGKNCSLGHNTIIEKNVILGNNCSIGSNVIIRNSIIANNVQILDNVVVGKKGFGFFPKVNKNLRFPHIGCVLIGENSEIGCGSTIDRGSLSNTIIVKNTYLDNQVHIAHNVKIGDNTIIAGQVGIAGSSVIGNFVKIGGQAGISGHLKIGNNVEIGGGSGVIKSIPDNNKVMGYPAKDIRTFLKERK